MEGRSGGAERLRIDRRSFIARGGKLGLASLTLPALLAACGSSDSGSDEQTTLPDDGGSSLAQGTVIVGDVLDHALSSDEWEGAFGFVKFRLNRGVFDGNDIYFIRTDASDQTFASDQKLVYVPKMQGLTGKLSGDVYLFDAGADDQPALFTSEPGQPDYTPAWQVNRVAWGSTPRALASVAELRKAEAAGDVTVERTESILNAPIVKWSGGELAADGKLDAYLGDGQLISAPDTSAMEVTFKLHECFPASRYIVTDHSIGPAAEMTHTAYAPDLHSKVTEAKATGTTNVFMNGIEGSGPMGFQPSVFDSDPGMPEWSPYWDHYSYEWKKDGSASVLEAQQEIVARRDSGELKEYPGVPDTKGEVFTVNCPVPVVAPTTFTG